MSNIALQVEGLSSSDAVAAGTASPAGADNTTGAACPAGTTGPSSLNDGFSAPIPLNTASASASLIGLAETSPTVKDVTPIFTVNPASQGFSAFLSSMSVSGNTQLTGWTVTSPYFDSDSFDETTGEYTVPASGVYIIGAAINYSTASPITVSIGDTINPTFVVRRTSPVVTDLISGLLPVLDVNVVLVLTLRAILGNGMVPLIGEADLEAGDVIGLFYEADGLGVTLNLGGSEAAGIVWSINRLT